MSKKSNGSLGATGGTKREPRVIRITRSRNAKIPEKPLPVHRRGRGGCSTYPVIVIGFSVQAQPQGADQRDGHRAVRNMLK